MGHLEGRFKSHGNISLYYQRWLPTDEPRGILLVVHGLAEHSGRYSNLTDYLVPKGYGVYGYDQRGHGKSDGPRGYIDRFSSFVDDLDIFCGFVRGNHRDARIFLLGHSMGGTIAATYAITHQDGFDGLILSGASLSPPADVSAGMVLAARFLSLMLPKAGLYIIDAAGLSQDEKVVSAYISDPLVYRGKIRARLGVELMKAMAMVRRQIHEVNLPILALHGTEDRLCDPEGSEALYQNAGSEDKTLILYPGYYHEILNEPGHQQVLVDIEAWLRSHT